MKISNPLGRLIPDKQVQRNGFDRSFRSTFHYSAGQLVPVFCEPVIAGSTIKLNRRTFQRTADVNTAAFSLLDTHTDFYAVPLNQICSRWEEFKTQINDVTSSAFAVAPAEVGESIQVSSLNSLPYINLYHLRSDLWNASLAPTTDGGGFSFRAGALRLLDMLGYGNYYTDLDFPSNNFLVSPLKLCAYQKVYFDHYRNTSYEASNPFAYNIDAYCLPSNQGQMLPEFMQMELLTLRYVNYRNDYFRSIYPSLNYSSNMGTSINTWKVPSDVMFKLTLNNNNAAVGNYNQFGGQTAILSPINPAGSYTGHSVQQIRAAFALDKLMRSASYAPKHVKAQYEAQFGVSIPDSHNESIRIGSFHHDITIGEVTSTADTLSGSNGQRLGSIGGRGIGGSDFGQEITYNAPFDSIIIGVQYTLPRCMYDSVRVDKWNSKLERNDFFHTAWQDLGLRPFYKWQFKHTLVEDNPNYPYSYGNGIMGYQTPYMEYKTGIDTNHGLFGLESSSMRDNSMKAFTVHSNGSSRYDTDDMTGLTSLYFKVLPSDLNSIFVDSYDGTYMTDQFFGYTDFSFKVACNMSVHGQPSL